MSTPGFHRDTDREHCGRREHDRRQGRPTHQMRRSETKAKQREWRGGAASWMENTETRNLEDETGGGEGIDKARSRGVDGERVGGCQAFSHRGVTERWLQ